MRTHRRCGTERVYVANVQSLDPRINSSVLHVGVENMKMSNHLAHRARIRTLQVTDHAVRVLVNLTLSSHYVIRCAGLRV